MIKSLAGLVSAVLLPEIRALREDLKQTNYQLSEIAAALIYRNAQEYGAVVQANPAVPPVEVTYVNDVYQAEIMEIELRLTSASGMVPTEDDVLAEYERMHPQEVEL